MPTHEYVCGSCQHEFEVLVRSAPDAKKRQCPRCRGTTVKRKPSVFAARQGSSRQPGTVPDPCNQCGLHGSCPMK